MLPASATSCSVAGRQSDHFNNTVKALEFSRNCLADIHQNFML